MKAIGIPSSTRNQIVTNLRKNGSLSVNELAAKAGISAMGIRQHLIYLEKAGLVSKEQRRQPIGRPCTFYNLTEAAETLFPKFYAQFAMSILSDISRHEGEEKLELIFKWRHQRLCKRFKSGITQEKLTDRIDELVKIMHGHGLSCEYKIQNSKVSISTFNCPLYEIAKAYPRLCYYDCELMSGLLRIDFKQKQSFLHGDNCCELIADNNDDQ